MCQKNEFSQRGAPCQMCDGATTRRELSSHNTALTESNQMSNNDMMYGQIMDNVSIPAWGEKLNRGLNQTDRRELSHQTPLEYDATYQFIPQRCFDGSCDNDYDAKLLFAQQQLALYCSTQGRPFVDQVLGPNCAPYFGDDCCMRERPNGPYESKDFCPTCQGRQWCHGLDATNPENIGCGVLRYR